MAVYEDHLLGTYVRLYAVFLQSYLNKIEIEAKGGASLFFLLIANTTLFTSLAPNSIVSNRWKYANRR